jgi:CheY-like chemotaxis protein
MGTPVLRARAVPAPTGSVAMARVLALTRDLLFGSQVQGALTLAGYDVELLGDEALLKRRLADCADGGGDREAAPADVLVVDLTDADLDGASVVEALLAAGELGSIRTLGFYSHVDVAARERAERAGFDVVVARSRMAREGVELVASVLAASP